MSELDRIAELAVQNERERIYGLLLMHPWRGPDADEDAATRRAIVRAAAEIGRAMP